MFRDLKGLLCAGLVCLASTSHAATYTFTDEERSYDDTYLATTIQLSGTLVDESGSPVNGAAVSLIAWGDSAANHGATTSTAANGRFVLDDLIRRNALLQVIHEDYYTEIIPLDLQRPLGHGTVTAGEIVLIARQAGRARLIFGGDTMLARKFVDRDKDGIDGESHDLIRRDSIAEDSEAIFRYVRDVLSSDDHTSVNLETAVTRDRSTPHSRKAHVFHTYPESLSIFRSVGIESVSLGNNHSYDYGDVGFSNTLSALTAHGLGFYGGGMHETEARNRRLRRTIGGIDFAFQGFNQQMGTNYGSDSLHIVAKDSPMVKAGALYLDGSNLSEFVAEEQPGCFTVPYFHGGDEYAWFQTDAMRSRFREAIDQGAHMVMSAHPHYAQGISLYDAGDGPRYIFGSLGNFVFDMGYFESIRTYIAMVDVDATPLGPRVSRVRLIPIWLDRYIPRMMVGDGLARMGRQIGHLSTAEGTFGDGIQGATVFPENGRIVVASSSSEYATSDTLDTRDLALGSSRKTGLFELDRNTDADFLARLTSDAPASCEVGRDIMFVGGFEDIDVDPDAHEGDRWTRSSSRYTQNSVTRNGSSAAVILRKSSNTGRSVLWVYNQIKAIPGKKYTITGYYKAENASKMEVAVRWMKSSSSTVSYSTKHTDTSRNQGWQRFSVDVTAPSNAVKIKVYLRGYPPSSGQARYFFDDLAIVEWDDTSHDAGDGAEFATPNDWSYMRCQAERSASRLGLTVRHRSYESR